MSFIQVIIYTAFIAVFASFIRWYLRNRKLNALIDKLPGTPGKFLFGNSGWVIKAYTSHPDPPTAILERIMGYVNIYEKEGCFAFRTLLWPLVNIFSPEMIEMILGSNIFLEKSFEYTFLHKWLGLGLLTSSGDKWRSRRKLLTPSFHFRILDDFLPIFNEQSMVLVKKLQIHSDKECADISPFIILCTLDIVCETVMGHEIGAQEGENADYVTAIHNLADFFNKRTASPWLWSDTLFGITKIGKEFQKDLDILHDFTKKVIKEKKESLLKKSPSTKNREKEDEFQGKKRKAFMDLLLDMHLQGEQLTENDIQEEVDTFMFEGHDTTAMGIIFALYCIGLYPDVQNKIYEEIHSIFGEDTERNISMDDVRNMKYLECTLKESQRLYPSVPAIGRKLGEDLYHNGLMIPKGVTVHCNIIGLHRNSKHFPNPEVFDPDRFLPENCVKRHPYCYVPFSAGPRNCIGQKFALLEMKVLITNILRNFKIISLDPRDKIQVKIEFTLRPSQPIRLKFLKRK